MAWIEERKSKDGSVKYKAVVRINGYPTQTATFSRKHDAKQWVQQTESEMRTGRYNDVAPSVRRKTFSDMVERYLSAVVPTRHARGKAGQVIERHLGWWNKRLGQYALHQITPAKIAELRDELLVSPAVDRYGAPLKADRGPGKRFKSSSTVVRYLASLSVLYSTAVKEWGWVQENPVTRVRRPTEPRGRVRFLSTDERAALLKACRASQNPFLYPIVVLALSTGARQMEILSLRWRQVDLDRQVIRLEDTKNRERRSIPLVGFAHSVLSELHLNRKGPTDLVFPRPDGRKPTHIEAAWKKAVVQAGITDFRFHDLRHTAASYLAMSGATTAEIAEVLGHKTLQMVKRYAHLSEQHTARILSKMTKDIFDE
jgi:integrase